ncbi:hypothetical protein [Streptomyces sp. Tue6028]
MTEGPAEFCCMLVCGGTSEGTAFVAEDVLSTPGPRQGVRPPAASS